MRSIIITGGELFNKGAQAMTFVAVSELKRRFPDHEILVLSEQDRKRPQHELDAYAFRIIGWSSLKFAKAQQNLFIQMQCLLCNHQEYQEAIKIYKNCDMIVDVSGYAVGANWGENHLNTFADHLEYAKAFHIPIYLMPQSFGPFNFAERGKKNVGERILSLLPEAKIICAREKAGYDTLTQDLSLNNVLLQPDLVLNNKQIDLQRIYRKPQKWNVPSIKKESVCIVPNNKTLDVYGKDRFWALYKQLIAFLRDLNIPVYIIRHSEQDRMLCHVLKALYSDDSDVVLLDREFNCFEFNELVNCFRAIIASRYHAIVHAYKNSVPCLVLGWADKYGELMEFFCQSKYYIDLRETIDIREIEHLLNLLLDRREQEADTIRHSLASIQEKNVFDILSLKG